VEACKESRKGRQTRLLESGGKGCFGNPLHIQTAEFSAQVSWTSDGQCEGAEGFQGGGGPRQVQPHTNKWPVCLSCGTGFQPVMAMGGTPMPQIWDTCFRGCVLSTAPHKSVSDFHAQGGFGSFFGAVADRKHLLGFASLNPTYRYSAKRMVSFVGWVEFLAPIVLHSGGPFRGTKPNSPEPSRKGCGKTAPRCTG
jgi:hypothetical protein